MDVLFVHTLVKEYGGSYQGQLGVMADMHFRNLTMIHILYKWVFYILTAVLLLYSALLP